MAAHEQAGAAFVEFLLRHRSAVWGRLWEEAGRMVPQDCRYALLLPHAQLSGRYAAAICYLLLARSYLMLIVKDCNQRQTV